MHNPFYLLFLPSIGVPELILLSVLVLILFGPGKLPEVFRSLGDGVKQFKKAASDVNNELKSE
jgi:sec-independent protein translocase protein TatA